MKAKFFFKYGLSLVLFTSLILTTSCSEDDPPLSDLTGITSFSFIDDVVKDYPFIVDNTRFVIENTDSLPYQFDVTSLIAQYNLIGGSTITVNGLDQQSGVSINDFSNSVMYTVTAEDGVTVKNYDVNVHVAKLNPEEVNWNQTVPNAFDETYETQEHFYLNGKHFVIIGKKFQWFVSGAESKLYSSEDGTSWNEETVSGDFPIGYDHNIVVSNGTAYVVGLVSGVDTYGADQPTLEGNLFSSTDGVNWTKTEGGLDVGRILTSAVDLDGTIYAYGGNLQGGFGAFTGAKGLDAPFFPAAAISNTTLIGSGGVFTVSAEYTAEMPRRTLSASCAYDGKMYVIGGLDALGFPLSDVWSSHDGVSWTLVSDGGFAARMKTSTVVYDDKIWMFGGQLSDGTCTSEVLVSADGGVSWSPVEEFQNLPENYTPRCNADVSIDSNGKIWIVGGESTVVSENEDGDQVIETTVLTDVWSGKMNKI